MQFEQRRRPSECKVFVCTWPRATLHTRIDDRVVRMFADGLVEETEQLLRHYGTLSHTAAKAVGYNEAIEHLAGRLTLEQTVLDVQAHTRQLARRQETFLRSFGERRVLDLSEDASLRQTQQRVLELVQSTS